MRATAMWLIWLALLAGSVALTVLVSFYETPGAEANVIRAAQTWPVPGIAFSRAVRAVTTTQFVLVVGAASVVVLWWSGARREAITLAVLFIVLPLAQSGLKLLVDRPRPDDALVRAEISSPSFPAGHVMGPTVVYGSLLYFGLFSSRWSRWWRLIAVSWSVVILATTGIVNVYLGVHWPTDVLGGYLWGLVLLLPAAGVARGWQSVRVVRCMVRESGALHARVRHGRTQPNGGTLRGSGPDFRPRAVDFTASRAPEHHDAGRHNWMGGADCGARWAD